MWHLFFLFAHDLLKKALPCVPEWQKQRFYWELDDLGTRLGIRMKTKCLMLGVQLSGIHRSISGRSWRQWRLPRGCFKSKEHVEVQTLHVSFSWENIHGLKIPWLSPSLSLYIHIHIHIYIYIICIGRYKSDIEPDLFGVKDCFQDFERTPRVSSAWTWATACVLTGAAVEGRALDLSRSGQQHGSEGIYAANVRWLHCWADRLCCWRYPNGPKCLGSWTWWHA